MLKRKVIDGVHKGKKRMQPHSFWTLCAQDLKRVFSEIIYDDQLLKECYCDIRSRMFDEEFIDEITTGIPTAIICDADNPEDFLKSDMISYGVANPYLIINDVGTGKSTYLNHYFKVKVHKYKLDGLIHGIIINVRDLGEGDDLPFSVVLKFVYDKINEYLLSNFPDISSPDIGLIDDLFNQELIPYGGVVKILKKKGDDNLEDFYLSKLTEFVSDVALFNKARIRYLLKRKVKIFVVIDNVDHYGKRTQEKVFGLSTKIINELGVSVIMSARDYTLPALFRHVSLSAFEPRFLHLALPDTCGVLQKRIDYMLKNKFIDLIFDKIGKDQIHIETPSGLKIVFDKRRLNKEYEAIIDSLLGNAQIIRMLENLSNYDVRSMLKMMRVALSSGYLMPEERDEEDGVRPRDFLRAIMCGNNPYFIPLDPSTMVINVFDNGEPNYYGNNLIRLRCLQIVKEYGDNAPLDDIVKHLEFIGYQNQKVYKVLQGMIDFGLVESPFYEGRDIDNDNIKVLRLTYCGEYYINTLIYDEIYIEEIKNATALDEDVIELIEIYNEQGRNGRVSKIERVTARLNATKIFLDALSQQEDLEDKRIRYESDPNTLERYSPVEKSIKSIVNSYNNKADKIIESLKRI